MSVPWYYKSQLQGDLYGECSIDGGEGAGCGLFGSNESTSVCPDGFCRGFAQVGNGKVAFVQYGADVNGSGSYAVLSTPIPDPALPINQINAAYQLACKYASSACGENDKVLVRYVGSTYNVQLVGNALNGSAAASDGYQDPSLSNSFFHPGADASYYVGGGYVGLDAGHVVAAQNGMEAHYDSFAPYNPFHWFFEALPSLFINTRGTAVPVPYTCSVSGGCH